MSFFPGPCKGEEEGKRERQANVICRHRKWDSSGEMFEESQNEAVRDCDSLIIYCHYNINCAYVCIVHRTRSLRRTKPVEPLEQVLLPEENYRHCVAIFLCLCISKCKCMLQIYIEIYVVS